jgi:hypothetical protein
MDDLLSEGIDWKSMWVIFTLWRCLLGSTWHSWCSTF